MPRDGAIIFGDLIGKLDALNVHCPKCSRAGRYRVPLLIDDRSPDAKVVDWLTADCPKATKAYHWRIRRIRSEAAN